MPVMETITVPAPSIRCGHCTGTHNSIADVRACSARPVTGAPVASPLARLNDAVMFEIEAHRSALRACLDTLAVPGGWYRDMMETYLSRPAHTNNVGALLNMLREAQKYPLRSEGAPVPAEPSAPRTTGGTRTRVTEAGMYSHGDKIYNVRANKAGTGLYAQLVVVKNGKPELEYAPGMVTHLSADERMSVDAVVAFNKRHAWCSVCGRHLKAKASVDRGIGPVCITRV